LGAFPEIYVKIGDEIQEGAPIFKMDDSKQQAAAETRAAASSRSTPRWPWRRTIRAAAEGQVAQARGSYQQALDELATKQELNRRGADIVARREIERL
jgi:multidrug resistance efflux pump